MDIHKMTVAELAEEAENNVLVQHSIWTKAYQMEKELKETKEKFSISDAMNVSLCNENVELEQELKETKEVKHLNKMIDLLIDDMMKIDHHASKYLWRNIKAQHKGTQLELTKSQVYKLHYSMKAEKD